MCIYICTEESAGFVSFIEVGFFFPIRGEETSELKTATFMLAVRIYIFSAKKTRRTSGAIITVFLQYQLCT